MKLTRIELIDFRCFEKAVFDLAVPETGKPLETVVIVGDNGSGKTAVLRGVAATLGQYLAPTDPDPMTPEDIRGRCKQGGVQVRILDNYRQEPGASFEDELDFAVWVNRNGRVQESLPQRYSAWSMSARYNRGRTTGFVTAYDVYRILPSKVIPGPNKSNVLSHRLKQSLTPTIRRDAGLADRFSQLKQWIINLDYAAAKQKRVADWERLQRVLNDLFAPFVFTEVDEGAKGYEIFFQSPHGRVRLEQLSDGYRSIFTIVVDLLLRLSLCAEEGGEVLTLPGVCLIDEIDAHLHPKWQARIMPALRKLFPNMQFIVTTHSPLIVASVRPENVFMLEDV